MSKVINILTNDIIEFHNQLQASSIMKSGVHDIALLASAVNSPFQTFGGEDLYPTVQDKAAQLCYSLVKNHPFTDGNKRTAFHALLVYLLLEDIELTYTIDEAETLIVGVADGSIPFDMLKDWIINHQRI